MNVYYLASSSPFVWHMRVPSFFGFLLSWERKAHILLCCPILFKIFPDGSTFFGRRGREEILKQLHSSSFFPLAETIIIISIVWLKVKIYWLFNLSPAPLHFSRLLPYFPFAHCLLFQGEEGGSLTKMEARFGNPICSALHTRLKKPFEHWNVCG